MSRIRVLIADDHGLVRDGLKVLLEGSGVIEVVSVARSGRDAVELANTLRPDVVLMDIRMPDLNGLEAAAQIRRLCPSTRVVILSMHVAPEHLYRALEAGVAGYILKESTGPEAVAAVQAVHAGRRYYGQGVVDVLADSFVRHQRPGVHTAGPDSLSPRERQVLKLVVAGQSTSEIATAIGTSPNAVSVYRNRLMRKLGVKDAAALIRYAIVLNLDEDEPASSDQAAKAS